MCTRECSPTAVSPERCRDRAEVWAPSAEQHDSSTPNITNGDF